MIEGVHEGFKKQLEIVGIGYRGQMKGNTLVLNIGYSHQVEIEAEEGVTIETPNKYNNRCIWNLIKNVLVKLLLKLEK